MTLVAIDAGAPVRQQAAPVSGMLEVEGLELTYSTRKGSITALQNLSLSVGAGEFVSLLGPSGCGKSSLLRVAAGLSRPSAGRVAIHGKPVAGTRPDVGMVFQKPTLLPWKTVLENVLLPARTLKLDIDKATRNAHDLLKRVGLDGFADNYPFELSGGMQQRVGLIRMLVHDPMLLLMDEPFAALDALTREHLMLELQRIWQTSRKSVLFVTHSIPEAVFLSDRVLVMSARPGRVIAQLRIELERPRTLESLVSPKFGEYEHQLRKLLMGGVT